jgi:hypothetical protein
MKKFIVPTIEEYLNEKHALTQSNENATTPHYLVNKDINNSGFGQDIYKIKMLIDNTEIGVLLLRIFTEKKKAEVMRIDIIDAYKRKGFGTQLYFKAKEIANDHDSNLYGGEIQSNDAKEIWKSFVKKQLTKKDADGELYI